MYTAWSKDQKRLAFHNNSGTGQYAHLHIDGNMVELVVCPGGENSKQITILSIPFEELVHMTALVPIEEPK